MKLYINDTIPLFQSHALMLLILFATIFGSNAQDEVISINLKEVFELAGANNLTIKEYEERQKLAEAELVRAKEWWLPTVYGGFQTQQLNGAAMNSNGEFFLDIKRNSLWIGLGASISLDFSEGNHTRKAVDFQRAASVYRTDIEKNKVLMQCIEAYYNLMAAQLNYSAFEELVDQSDTIIEQIEVKVLAGLLFESELLIAKSNKNHLRVEMLSSQQAYLEASSKLKSLLNIGPNVRLISSDEQLVPLDYAIELIDPSDSIHKLHPEMKVNELEIQSLQEQLIMTTSGLWVPTLSIGTNASYFGRIYGQVTPADPFSYPNPNQLYPTATLNTSLIWSIPIGKFTHKGDKLRYESLIRIKELEAIQFEAKINDEIVLAMSNIQLGTVQIEIAIEGMELTEKALDQSMQRQQLRTSKPFELFQAQQFYLQARMDYLKAVSVFNKAQFSLKIAKGEIL